MQILKRPKLHSAQRAKRDDLVSGNQQTSQIIRQLAANHKTDYSYCSDLVIAAHKLILPPPERRQQN